MVVLRVALAVLLVKFLIAATTFGTNDIAHWATFLTGVTQAGPVGIYGLVFADGSFYNHPPLIGYFLELLDLVQRAGIPFRFTLRAISSLADVGSALVVFELVRRRRPTAQATRCAILVAASPLLVMVSGFHGNTDPIFIFLVLLGMYLLVDREMPTAAGAVLALAIGIKIVPMVVLPALAVFAYRRAPRDLVRCAAGFAAVFVVTWGPALLREWGPVRRDVLGYSGYVTSPWGISQLGHWLGDPHWVTWFDGPGRFVVLLVCAAVPAVATWRRPDVILPAVAWSLVGFLALAPSWAVQYMVWPLAVGYLIGVGWASAYNLAGSVVLFIVYNRWSGGLPWYRAHATFAVPTSELIVMMACWVVLVALLIRATIVLFAAAPAALGAAGNGHETGESDGQKNRRQAAGTRAHRRRGGGLQR